MVFVSAFWVRAWLLWYNAYPLVFMGILGASRLVLSVCLLYHSQELLLPILWCLFVEALVIIQVTYFVGTEENMAWKRVFK